MAVQFFSGQLSNNISQIICIQGDIRPPGNNADTVYSYTHTPTVSLLDPLTYIHPQACPHCLLSMGVELKLFPRTPSLRLCLRSCPRWHRPSAWPAVALWWSAPRRPRPAWWCGGRSESSAATPWKAHSAAVTRANTRWGGCVCADTAWCVCGLTTSRGSYSPVNHTVSD